MSWPEEPKKIVKIAEFKNRLSHYLRRVQQGESILVADRDQPAMPNGWHGWSVAASCAAALREREEGR